MWQETIGSHTKEWSKGENISKTYIMGAFIK